LPWWSSTKRSFAANTDISGYNSQVCAVLGAQWGDEGKGKLVDVLAKRYDIVGRFNGGANAGHTLVVDGKKFAFHLLPCGMLYPGKINIIGNGVVLHLPTMLAELKKLADAGIDYRGRLLISDRAQLLFEAHKILDGRQEDALGGANIGTTRKGIGPCYSSKATRIGVRVGDLANWDVFKKRHEHLIVSLQQQVKFDYDLREEQTRMKQYYEQIKDMIVDSVSYLNNALKKGKTVLAEGANAALLDIDFGTYPFVTSSPTTAGGICTGLGIPPTKIDSVIGVVKAYTTRVGSGPFPSELIDATGEKLRAIGHELGTTTGRPRRCGWLDIPVLQYSHALNNYQSLNVTKLDVLSDFPELKIGVSYKLDGKRLAPGLMPSTLAQLEKVQIEYETMPGWKSDISKCRTFEELPAAAKAYLRRIEELVGVPVSWVGVGAGRNDMATKGFLVR
jgi:adenylosuccinate synthase